MEIFCAGEHEESRVASPPDRKVTRDDSTLAQCGAPTGGNGQLAKSGSLTIVRRSSTKKPGSKGNYAESPPESPLAEEALNVVDLATDKLPAIDTPDACDKAALRLRCLLRLLERGEISAEVLQKNLLYAARVLEAVFIDETK
ncbi:UNVERIFIED_CONTAM: hypothetical protein PYX00_006549 [Menopon gallinae]|uniref:Uncharacterized protein n=1 Tax=Menopon gallinae TaxID=328185 RepID=A0AAW2HVP2_9NEOP